MAPLLVCPIHVVLGVDCPACGATRGVQALVAGDVAAALNHNLLIAVAVPLGLLWTVASVRELAGGATAAWPTLSRRGWAWAIVALAAFTVVRNLGLPGVAWLDAA